MEQKNNVRAICALIIRILGLFIGITAITLQLVTNATSGNGFMGNHVLAYFTVQTNILSSLIFLYLIIKTIVVLIKTKELKVVNMYPSLHLACTFYITITMTVYWGILAPMLGVGDTPLMICDTLFLHLFTPLIAIIDTLLFFKHGKLKKLDALKWEAYPVLYLISVIIIANTSDKPYYKFPMGDKVISLMYPYPFLDPEVVTIGGMIGVMIGLLIIVYLFGLLYIYIDNKVSKFNNKIINNLD